MAGNPFRYGDVATGKFFTNRARELAEVKADIHNGQNIVMISPRRYGKTSLIREAMQQRELIVTVAGNGYRIADVFLREWIIRRATP